MSYFEKVKKIVNEHIVKVLGADEKDWFDTSNPNIVDIVELKLMVEMITKNSKELKTILDKCIDTWPKPLECPINMKLFDNAFLVYQMHEIFGNMLNTKDFGDPITIKSEFDNISDIFNVDKPKMLQ